MVKIGIRTQFAAPEKRKVRSNRCATFGRSIKSQVAGTKVRVTSSFYQVPRIKLQGQRGK